MFRDCLERQYRKLYAMAADADLRESWEERDMLLEACERLAEILSKRYSVTMPTGW